MTETNPFVKIMETSTAFWLSRSLHVVAELGVADALGDSPQTAAELAKSVGAHPGALARVLRLLASAGIFESTDQNRYSHNDASRFLRNDHPMSLRAFVRMIGSELCWTSFGSLSESVRTSKPAVEKVFPGGLFKYLGEHPEAARVFDAAMTGKSHGQVAAVVGAYDFSPFKRIADIGGGRGHLLQRILETTPSANGVLFDLPHVTQEASALASDRLKLQPGDFFKDTLPTADLYVLMEVIHDWADEEAVRILKAVRSAAPPDSKLLVVENIVPETSAPHWAKALDINMLAMTGGLERTRGEYEKLLATAGFRLSRVIETPAVAIIEGTPA